MWHRRSSHLILLLLSGAAIPAAAQVEVTVHGGVHMGEAGAGRHSLEQSARAAGPSRLVGEATTAGARLGVEPRENAPRVRTWGVGCRRGDPSTCPG
jgi:hypothetical protein